MMYGQDIPFPQPSKLSRPPNLIPPHGGGQDRTQRQRRKRAHEQIPMLHMVLKGIKHAQQRQARRSHQPGKQGGKTRLLPPLGVVSQAKEFVRVPHVVHGEHGARKRDPGQGAPRDEHGLEGEGADVTDEGDVWVDLARVAGLADGEPADEEDGERGEPGEACGEREEVEVVGVVEVVREDAGPEAWTVTSGW